MNLRDVLAKLGILRFGTKAAVYKSAVERPSELQMDGVFNAERDLVSRPKPQAGDKGKAARR